MPEPGRVRVPGAVAGRPGFRESDPLTVDLGDGNDTLVSQVEPFLGIPISTGPWHVTGGSGNDAIEGSAGGNVIDGGPGSDTIRGFPVELVPAGRIDIHKDRPDLSAGDSIFGGSGNDYIDPGFSASARTSSTATARSST